MKACESTFHRWKYWHKKQKAEACAECDHHDECIESGYPFYQPPLTPDAKLCPKCKGFASNNFCFPDDHPSKYFCERCNINFDQNGKIAGKLCPKCGREMSVPPSPEREWRCWCGHSEKVVDSYHKSDKPVPESEGREA